MARSETTLRLVWPQWQGAGTSSVGPMLPEFDRELARRGYAVGTAVLDALLPPRQDAAVAAPVRFDARDLTARDGIEARQVVVHQLEQALDVLRREDPARVLTLGGECSVSVAPFAHLAARHGDDLAVVWVDSHPDVDTPTTDYEGYHAMSLSALVGRCGPEVRSLLPATLDPSRVAVAGLHSWTEDAIGHLDEWGIASFSPDQLRGGAGPLRDWLDATGCRKLAIHFDVDTVDADEVVLGLGAERGGLTGRQVHRVVQELAEVADVVGLTIAEFIPRQVVRLLEILDGMPLVGTTLAGAPTDPANWPTSIRTSSDPSASAGHTAWAPPTSA